MVCIILKLRFKLRGLQQSSSKILVEILSMALIRPACPLSPTKLNVFTVNSYLVLFFRRVCMYITNILMKWKTSYVSLFTMYEGGSSLGAGGSMTSLPLEGGVILTPQYPSFWTHTLVLKKYDIEKIIIVFQSLMK